MHVQQHDECHGHSTLHTRDDTAPRHPTACVLPGPTRRHCLVQVTAHCLYCWHQRKEDDYALRPEWAAAHGEHQRLVCGAEFFAKLLESGLYAED